MIRGVCEPSRLLDLVENFTLYSEAEGETAKANREEPPIHRGEPGDRGTEQIKRNQGKLGVFWDTQGSGKSFSMVFFSQKVLRKLPGNWTFLIITDRKIWTVKSIETSLLQVPFSKTRKSVRAQSAEHLKTLF